MIYWTGAATRLGWDSATFSGTFSGGIRYSTAANDVDKDNERNGTAPLTPHSAAMLQETVMTMTTTIASPVMIESTGANTTVLVPHGAELPPPPPLPAADSTLSPLLSDPALSANALTHAPSNATDAPTYASFFVLGRGRRDDGADGIVVVGGGGAHGDVHRGRRGSADDYGDADCDDILC